MPIERVIRIINLNYAAVGNMKKRFEQKLLVPPFFVEDILKFLRHSCVEDRRYKEDTVCSIYFDSNDLRSFAEVINGDICKDKLRLRWYESSSERKNRKYFEAYLEVKKKEGFQSEKIRKKLTLKSDILQNPMLEENYLTDDLKRAFAEIDGPSSDQHHPILLIKYKRHRFVEPLSGMRLCLDSEIRVSDVNSRILKKSRPVTTNKAVLEIKGSHYTWPKSLRNLQSFPLRAGAFSKYAFCVDACKFFPEFSKKWG